MKVEVIGFIKRFEWIIIKREKWMMKGVVIVVVVEDSYLIVVGVIRENVVINNL